MRSWANRCSVVGREAARQVRRLRVLGVHPIFVLDLQAPVLSQNQKLAWGVDEGDLLPSPNNEFALAVPVDGGISLTELPPESRPGDFEDLCGHADLSRRVPDPSSIDTGGQS